MREGTRYSIYATFCTPEDFCARSVLVAATTDRDLVASYTRSLFHSYSILKDSCNNLPYQVRLHLWLDHR